LTRPRFIQPALPTLAVLLVACTLSTVQNQEPASTATPVSLSPVGEEVQYGVWLHPALPPTLAAAATSVFEDPTFVRSDTPEAAAVQITPWPGEASPLRTTWIYAVVAPFPTVPDDIGWEALGRYWQGDPGALPEFGTPQLILSQDSAELLTVTYGPTAPGTPLTIAPAEQVLDQAWATRPALSVVPFESLDPRWKVLAVDGQPAIDKALNIEEYPFAVEFGLTGDPAVAAQIAETIQSKGTWPTSNVDPMRMTVVTMTGVTALSRAVAWNMENIGIEAQGADIKPLLADADILHVSNEVAFAPGCPPPDPNGEPKFCSDDRYMALLRDLDPDVIELTGNHINDWGVEAFVHTLDVYDQDEIPYFGGGRSLDEARQTVVIESFGNRIAFLGCNLPGPAKAWAADLYAGAAPCDDYAAFQAQVAAAREAADVVIATQQYYEFEHPDPTPQQVADFTAISEAGADIVSGSQAHQPQTLAFHQGRFIHYGLGNLFFDPLEDVKKQFFIDQHVIYDGRHISTVLLTGRIENYGRPAPMAPEERRAFLALMFAESGW